MDCPSYRRSGPASLYWRFEMEKKRQYGERVRQIELGSFTPIVLSTYRGMGPEASTLFRRLAGLIANKKEQRYSLVITCLRTRLSVLLLRSALMCLRGTRQSRVARSGLNQPLNPEMACND